MDNKVVWNYSNFLSWSQGILIDSIYNSTCYIVVIIIDFVSSSMRAFSKEHNSKNCTNLLIFVVVSK